MLIVKVSAFEGENDETRTASLEYDDATGALSFRTWLPSGFKSEPVTGAEAKTRIAEFLDSVTAAGVREWSAA